MFSENIFGRYYVTLCGVFIYMLTHATHHLMQNCFCTFFIIEFVYGEVVF